MAATPQISAKSLARAVGISVKSAIALLDAFVRDGIAVEVTGRAARRLFGPKALGEEARRVVRPPYRPEPGRGRGGPPLLPTAPEEATAPPLPALDPVLGPFPAIDYSGLQAAIAHADQVIRDSRRSFSGLARGEGAPASIPSQAAPTSQSAQPSDDLP